MKGQPLYLQMGADEFLDPTWGMPAVEQVDEAARKSDFAMIQAAGDAFAEADLPASLEDLRLNALQMARMVPELTAKEDAREIDAPSDRQVQASLVYGPTSVAHWDYRIYQGCRAKPVASN